MYTTVNPSFSILKWCSKGLNYMDVLTCCTTERNKVGKAWIYSIQTFTILLKKIVGRTEFHITGSHCHGFNSCANSVQTVTLYFCPSDLILHCKLSQALFS